MTLLPIVERELRVASRRRGTFRLRWWTALLGLGVACLFLLLAPLTGRRNAGAPLFSLLTWYMVGFSGLAGVLFTSHALTEEKRQGALGLLFLTDLRGYDVVLGKLVALSLNAFYIVLALLPATALPLLLGGVTGGEFWRVALVIPNVLFFSLASGLWVSACLRDSYQAAVVTLTLQLLFLLGLPAAGFLAARLHLPGPWLLVPCFSPAWAFHYASATLYPAHCDLFWGSVLGSGFLAWVFLGLASVILPRSLREPASVRLPKGIAGRTFTRGKRDGADAELLTRRPVQWLRAHELGIPWWAWAVVAVWGIVVAGVMLFDLTGNSGLALSGYAAWPFGFLLKLLFALQACQFFADGRRNGSLELLLCTPLTNREIVHGQLFALWRTFLWPLLAFSILLFAPTGLGMAEALSRHDVAPVLAALSHSVVSLFYAAHLLLDLLAICWFGMALALTMKRPAFAPALTILLVVLLPSVLCFGSFLADIGFIAWGMSRCQGDLRRLLSQQYQAPWPTITPQLVTKSLVIM